MTTELKILEDIGVCGCCEVEDQQEYGCMKPEIKSEAIKWIKELNEFPYKYNDSFGKTRDVFIIENEYGVDPLGLINWIKHFFNITEEELNDGIRGN